MRGGRQFDKGFTLLELMVVIVIVAMLFTFVALTIRTTAPEDLIKQEALRFDRLLQLILEESVLKNADYGIEFGTDGYRFLQYDDDKWSPITGDRVLRTRTLSNDMELELALEATDIEIHPVDPATIENKDDIKPQIYILSSSEITPEFELQFFIPTVSTRYRVTGEFNGKHHAERIE